MVAGMRPGVISKTTATLPDAPDEIEVIVTRPECRCRRFAKSDLARTLFAVNDAISVSKLRRMDSGVLL
jgi:hypothetical protein